METIESICKASSVSIAQKLSIAQKANLLRKTGYTKKLEIWVPPELTRKKLMGRTRICCRIIEKRPTSSEANVDRHCKMDHIQQCQMKTVPSTTTVFCTNGSSPGRYVLYFWWDWQGIRECYELLPYGQTLNSDLIC